MLEPIQERIPSPSRKLTSVVVVIILLGVCASSVMYHVTAQGPGVSPDSTIYIEAAKALLTGDGFFVYGQFMTHYPPVYPLLLAGVGLFTGNDIVLAARLLSALLFSVNLVLVALAVYICTRHHKRATGLVILIFLLSAPILSIHSMAWSEAPFIAFSMTSFILLSLYIACSNPKYLVLASFMAGLAAATRYIGITIFPASILALLILGHKSFRQKLIDIILFLSVAGLPLLSWLIRNMLVAESATNREVVFHPFSVNHVKSLIIKMYDFVLPISISGWTKALHLGLAAAVFALTCRFLFRKMGIKQSKSSISTVIPTILVIYSVLYVAFLFLSISFFDANTPVNHRLLLPVFLALIVASTSVVKAASEEIPQKWAWYSYVFLMLFSVSINAGPAISRAVAIHNKGIGYTARYWKQSATLAVLARVPQTMKIYSNGPGVIRFSTQKEVSQIPRKVFPVTRRENENYEGEMRQMIRECEKGKALIVYLDRLTEQWYLPSKEEIESQFKMPLLRAMEDGVIYGLAVMQNKAEQGAALD